VFEWLPDRIEQAKIISQEFEQDWKFIFNPPATEAAIQACEVALGVPLPPSYRDFLQKREQSPRLLSVGCSVSGFNRRQSLP
jgi:cell wall assembly regulator SMI1